MICFVHIGIWFNLFLLPLFIFSSQGEDKNPHPLSMWSSCLCVVCQANMQQPQDFLPSLLVSDFIFHCHWFLSWALLILSLLSSLLHNLHRQGTGQCRQDFLFLPLPFLVCFTYQGTRFLSSRSFVTEGKNIKLSPCPPSILHTVDQTDSASLKVIVSGVIPLGWMCVVCTFFPLQELKTNKK